MSKVILQKKGKKQVPVIVGTTTDQDADWIKQRGRAADLAATEEALRRYHEREAKKKQDGETTEGE